MNESAQIDPASGGPGTRFFRDLDDPRRLSGAIRIIAFGLVTGMGISWPAWISSRELPCIPLLGPERIPAPFDSLLAGGVVLLFLVLVFRPRDRRVLGAGLALLTLLFLQDQVRWQPWAWQYLLLLIPLLFTANSRAVLDLQGLMVAGVYTWSGLHKLGPGFRHMYERYLATPLLDHSPPALDQAWLALAWCIPVIETGIGIGLLFRASRKTCAVLAIGMHGFVMLLLGPLGLNSNHVVWPWNVAMPALVAVLFFSRETMDPAAWRAPRLRIAAAVLLTLTWLTPGLYYFGAWPHYLSFNLYSGRGMRGTLFLSPRAAAGVRDPFAARLHPSPNQAGWFELRFRGWCMAECRVPFPGEKRNYYAVVHRALQPGTKDDDALLVFDWPDLLHRTPEQLEPSAFAEDP